MEQNQNSSSPEGQTPIIPPGWVGGFSGIPPATYPNEELLKSIFPLQGNMDNINKLTRMLRADWPEFSWEAIIGEPTSRLFQRFASDISRLGYDDSGKVWSIICPQQGVYLGDLSCLTLNIEVTVTGNRGWVNENAINRGQLPPSQDNNELFAADITVEPKIWFSTEIEDSFYWQAFFNFNNQCCNNQLPLSKDKAIRIKTCNGIPLPNDYTPADAILVRIGESPYIQFPPRTKHWLGNGNGNAWAVANISVMMEEIVKTNDTNVDYFNSQVLNIFNYASGNLLQSGNTLTWNLWAGPPELVNQEEWRNHAEYWRTSIDVNHNAPESNGGSNIAYYDNTPYYNIVGYGQAALALSHLSVWIAEGGF